MEEIDKFSYLRQQMEDDFNSQFSEARSEVALNTEERLKKLEDDFRIYDISSYASKSKEFSIKKNVIVPNKTKSVDQSKYQMRFVYGVCIAAMCAGLATSPLMKQIMEKRFMDKEAWLVTEEYIMPNTNQVKGSNTYYYNDYDNIHNIMEYTNDPSLSLYFWEYAMDDYYGKSGAAVSYYNLGYNTDYTTMEEIIESLGFKNKKEWKKYVYNTLVEKKEQDLDVDSTIRR